MTGAKLGDTLKVHYQGTLEDGTVFDSTVGAEPFELTIGAGSVLPAFEAAVTGMVLGERKTFTLEPADAYGHYDEEMTQEIPRTAIPDEIELAVGMILSAESPDGIPISFTVKSFDDAQIVIDGNHPLAGRALTFTLELVELR